MPAGDVPSALPLTCHCCLFFERKLPVPPRADVTLLGFCHRHAPTQDGFPLVVSTSWCGDLKLNENLLY